MLKITLHDSASQLCFKLEGRLSGPWVTELRQCWQTAASTTHGRDTVVDLHEVDFVDPVGASLLAEMDVAGVRLQAHTPLIQSILDEACGPRRCGTVEEQPVSAHALLSADTNRTRSRAS